jgi:GT2 family glycosyltransferase
VESISLKKGFQVSVIVPTLRRPDYLLRCLSSLTRQTSTPTEILVGCRPDDQLTPPIIRMFFDRSEIKSIAAKGVGVVGSMNSCLAEAKGHLIGLVDDDVELPPEWLERMIYHLENHPDVLGVGARDFLQDHPIMRRSEPRISDVGRLYWFGRVTGNHYRGKGGPRKVDLLRGSNCLYRGAFLKSVGFDESLRGQGAQVHWELALALQVRQQGKRLFYDPEIEVLHHAAPRMGDDQIHRGQFSYNATVDLAYNETLVIIKHGSGLFRVMALLWQLLVGSPACPGMANFVRNAIKSKSSGFLKIRATFKGRFLALVAQAKASRDTERRQVRGLKVNTKVFNHRLQ